MRSPPKVFLLIVTLKATTDKWRFRFWLPGVQFVTAVCCTPLRSSLRCVAHCGDCLCVMLNTAEIISSVSCTPRRSSLRCVAHRGDFFELGAMDSTVCSTPWRQLCYRISQQNRNHIRKHFTLFIRGPTGFESWKNGGQKSLDKLFLMRSRSLDHGPVFK